MPTRHKPSQWQHLHIFKRTRARRWYSDAAIEAIVKAAEPANARQGEKIWGSVLWAALQLDFSLHYENRPSTPEVRAALTRLNKQLAAVQGSLDTLDGDTKRLIGFLFREPLKDFEVEDLEDPMALDNPYENHLDNKKQAIGEIAVAVNLALQFVGGKSDRRKGSLAVQAAVSDLYEAWTSIKKSDAKLAYNEKTKRTTGPFLNFVRLALAPVLDAHGLKTNLERYARNALYG